MIRSESSDLAEATALGLTVLDDPSPVAVRRAIENGAAGVLAADDLDVTLGPALAALRAGLCVVPRARARQVVRPALTHRERQVLGLVCEGRTNAEIGRALFLAESTVKCHLSTAFAKLGVVSRREAAAVARELSLELTVAG
jgi:DNA-binding NarL/FixJ family response regulator